MQIKNSIACWLPAILLFLLLSGCQPLSEFNQTDQTNFIPLESGASLGQSLVARYDGMSAVGLLIKPGDDDVGILKFDLYAHPDSQEALREVELPLSEVAYPAYTNFYFPPLSNSTNKDYFFTIRQTGNDSLQIGESDGRSYLDGSLYQDRQPSDGQLIFQLTYGRRLFIVGLIEEGIKWILLSLAGIYLFILPGWGLLCSLYPKWEKFSFLEKLGLSGGISIAIYPLILLWTYLAGIQPGSLLAWLPGATGIGLILFKNRQNLTKPGQLVKSVGNPGFPGLAALLVILILFFVRFTAIRTLDLPLWGDSYQHTMITQLIIDRAGLFDNWLPYAELQSFTYHFGFHTLAAVFHWVTGLSAPQSLLWTGQILNGLAVICLYPFALRLNKNPWSGVFAMLLAGLAFSMPMVYLNWGRYTQLAGLVILAAWVLLAWEFFDSPARSWKLLTLNWMALAGLALTHYRVLIFAILFIPAYFLIDLPKKRLLTILKRSIWIGIGAVFLVLPWYFHVYAGKLWTALTNLATRPVNQLASSSSEFYTIGNLFSYLPAWAWILVLFGLIIAILRRQTGILLVGLWWLLILLTANPQWFNLPGAGILTSFAVMIAAYFPAALIIGATFGQLMDLIVSIKWWKDLPANTSTTLREIVLPAILLLSILIAGIIGASARLREISPSQGALAVRPDLRAAQWIENNLPENARFLVNSFFAYEDTAIVGSDGGWWLPLIAGRQTSLPPLTYLSEKSPRPDYQAWINGLTADIQNKGLNDSQILQELAARGIDYIYIGQQQGLVNTAKPLIQLDTIVNNPRFEPVYHQDRVWIFKIIK